MHTIVQCSPDGGHVNGAFSCSEVPHRLLHALLLERSVWVTTSGESNNDPESPPSVWPQLDGVQTLQRWFCNLSHPHEHQHLFPRKSPLLMSWHTSIDVRREDQTRTDPRSSNDARSATDWRRIGFKKIDFNHRIDANLRGWHTLANHTSFSFLDHFPQQITDQV